MMMQSNTLLCVLLLAFLTSTVCGVCTSTSALWIGDGFCDDLNNNADCSWDGGDCCPQSCIPADGTCLKVDCKDPDYLATSSRTSTPPPLPSGCPIPDSGTSARLGDGYCDDSLNSKECGYDNGDCCTHTCVPSFYSCPWYTLINCKSLENCTQELLPTVGDGFCHTFLNTLDCAWDGGDCCPETCKSKGFGTCAIIQCDDPSHSKTASATPTPSAAPVGCNEENAAKYLGDGFCDDSLNIEACDWDRGDCCSFTCQPKYYDCVGGDTCHLLTNCNADDEGWIGDGYCDGSAYNTEDCAWDGGDCCPQSCHPSDGACTLIDCKDPLHSATFSTTPTPVVPSGCTAQDYATIGDGYCDDAYNNAACNWDGGDCCEYSCKPKYGNCPAWGFACKRLGKCAAFAKVGDKKCDLELNTEACDYDGGDCVSASPSTLPSGASNIASGALLRVLSVVVAVLAFACYH